MRSKTLCALVSLSLLLVACSYTFDVVVSELSSPTPLFEIKRPSRFIGWPRVTEITVWIDERGSNYRQRHIIWQIESQGIEVKSVRYGVVPDGFHETIRAEPLQIGLSYQLSGASLGGGSSTVFELRADDM